MTGKNRIRGNLPFWHAGRAQDRNPVRPVPSDVGFITMPDGRRIAMAFFARGGTNRPRTIAEAARAIYYGFTAAWRAPFTAAFSSP